VGIVLNTLLIDFQPFLQVTLLGSADPKETEMEHGVKARTSFISTGASAKSKAMPLLAMLE
jgi:hypothetical protein